MSTTVRWRFSRWLAACVMLAVLLPAVGQAMPAGAQPVGDEDDHFEQHATTIDTDEAVALAERFVPIVMVRVQESECDDFGEPYLPVPVDLVLGHPDVTLRQNAGGPRSEDPVLVTGPEAEDLAKAGPDTYLDLPGNPRDPGCTYERWYKSNMDGHAPSVYARVAETDTGQVVIQYHLYYVFNDFNNTHESDWEMVQLLFDVPTVAEALKREPTQVAYAQHGGGETADWDDDKLTREGDHVVVYASAGSHASQYGTETYIGWGANGTGFGCDNTQDPVRRVEVTPIVMTAAPDEPGNPQAWLAWEGRWGERQPWEYNGPFSPPASYRWADPVEWQSNLRDSSIYVPGTSRFGPGPTDVFCTISEIGSRALTFWAVDPWTVVFVLIVPLAIFVALLILARHTVVGAFRIYVRHLPVFAGLGVLLIPIGLVANGFHYLVTEYPPGRQVVEVMRFSPASDFGAALTVGSLQHFVSLLIIVPAVLVVYRDIEHGKKPTFLGALRGIQERLLLMVRALLWPWAKLFLATITIIGIPWAVDRSVRWGFIPHAVILDRVEPDGAPARSEAAVRKHWWRTAGTTFVLSVIGSAPGPVIGIILMITAQAGVQFVNALSSVIYAVFLPFAILGSAVLYRRRQGTPLPLEQETIEAQPDGSPAVNPTSA